MIFRVSRRFDVEDVRRRLNTSNSATGKTDRVIAYVKSARRADSKLRDGFTAQNTSELSKADRQHETE
jgi:hypothetical protein